MLSEWRLEVRSSYEERHAKTEMDAAISMVHWL